MDPLGTVACCDKMREGQRRQEIGARLHYHVSGSSSFKSSKHALSKRKRIFPAKFCSPRGLRGMDPQECLCDFVDNTMTFLFKDNFMYSQNELQVVGFFYVLLSILIRNRWTEVPFRNFMYLSYFLSHRNCCQQRDSIKKMNNILFFS